MRKGTWITSLRRSLRIRLQVVVLGLLLLMLAAFMLAGSQLFSSAVSGADEPAGREALRHLFVVAVVLTVIVGAALLATCRRLFTGLQRLLRAARSLAAGQCGVTLNRDSDDEIAELGAALQEMATRTEASYREIEEQNRNLERIVRARTEELRQKNLALAFQNEKVIEANRMKSAFLASMSHELRTPLNAILALSEMLRDQISGPLSREQVKQASMILTSGQNLLNLINDVLDLSRIESGRMEVKPERVQIVDRLVEAGEGLRPLAEEKGLTLEIQEEGLGSEVFLDLEKLRQVFINLLGNAIKFTDRGSVTIRIRLLPDQDLLYVEVQDTGPGIEPEFQHQLFQEFRRAEDGGAPEKKGTGLGLAISKKLVTLMGGDIWVDSAPGSGSRFAFVIPLHTTEEDQEAPEQGTTIAEWRRGQFAAREGEEGKQRVLVVEEDVVASGGLGRYLRRRGMEVLTALDVVEALETLRRVTGDLVLLDLVSPGDGGFRLLRRIGRDPRLQKIPVVVNASRELSEDEAGFLKPQVHSIFVKGTRGVSDLIDTVENALQVSRNGEARLPEHTAGGERLDGAA